MNIEINVRRMYESYEYPLVLLVVVIGIALTGAGAYSVDALFVMDRT